MINHIEIESQSRKNLQHILFLDEQGKAVGCTCEARQYHSFKPCRHMNEWNGKSELNSCILCGSLTKGVICNRCLN
jgi:hypothetical protein